MNIYFSSSSLPGKIVFATLSKHEQKYCSRCGTAFECKPGSISQCQCSGIQLSVEERVYIDSKYEDCLCIECLEGLQQEYIIFKKKHIFQ